MKKNDIIWLLVILCGCVGVVISGRAVEQDYKRDLNVLELNGSPYGELIGISVQDAVHLLIHAGQGHEHLKEGESCEVCGETHGVVRGQGWSLSDCKWKLQNLEKDVRANNSPTPHVGAAYAFEMKRAGELVEMAYELDPTNYANFNALSYFYASSLLKYEGAESGFEAVLALSQRTLEECDKKPLDVNDALTAASATESILIYKTSLSGGMEGVEAYLPYYQEHVSRVQRCHWVIEQSKLNGAFDGLSESRKAELVERVQQFNYLLNQYALKVRAYKQELRGKKSLPE
ncbi:hypothetical protein SAMN02745181_3615 [Rubritalea squalenifaciens DSM 18772]|uniref:Uncharacterized protein n=1 Tax=Rubritalea squalenifaciens DSM 18772 TaxID=1123071 RepID=A0A1M6RJ57_9BACT|nr:hypothetical protein [Rubritalea squalenifaciens]SHK32483.1 hypothetical protein SAMN02745181_3615 [Rubritalea squalenifaciens DSM 18772]